MKLKRRQLLQWIILGAVIGGICFAAVMLATGVSARAPQSPHHVYVAFGFHGNLYHSFRNDTNDETGFGKDIRVIRHIIAALDRWNRQGVQVKAVWDFDNLFSLQEILPQYAPDIIADIRRRIKANGDEAIVMSYNNGLVSAMTARELTDAVRWAISNPWHSGVQDLFGSYSPIVRPQEMMTTPGGFSIYRQLGIQAVALYYSATPFDAFRVFCRPLTPAEAHNPVLYKHPQTGEQMVVIPSYHIGDLVEHVSLRNWVEGLRNLQKKGELRHDALIFIKAAEPGLARRVDLSWREVAPAQIRFAPRATRQNPPRILKRNYLGVETHYDLDYFRHAPENLNLDNVNNHITQSYVGIVSGAYGMAIAADTTVQANFAFSPLKMTYDPGRDAFQIRANPFGTYYGRQYRPPTRGNGQGYEMTLYTGEQLASAAPTYNGADRSFSLLISFFKGGQMPRRLKEDLLAYAHPPLVVSLSAPAGDKAPIPPPLKTRGGFTAAYHAGSVHFFWDAADDPAGHYRIHCGTHPGSSEQVYPATGRSLQVQRFAHGRPFVLGQRYYARIEAVAAAGKKSDPSEEISFSIRPMAGAQSPRIPLDLKIRVLWANVRALIDDLLL